MKPSSTPVASALDVLNPEAFTAALFERAKAIQPDQPPVATVIDRLTPYRSTFLELRKQGYSLAQITGLLKEPPFDINISISTLRRLLEHAPRKRKPTPATIKCQAATGD